MVFLVGAALAFVCAVVTLLALITVVSEAMWNPLAEPRDRERFPRRYLDLAPPDDEPHA